MAQWLRPEALASHTGIAVKTLAKWRCSGEGPPFVRAGGVVLYDMRVVDEWLSARMRASTSDRPAAAAGGQR